MKIPKLRLDSQPADFCGILLARVGSDEFRLARCEGRIEGPTGAARMLEINPHTLRARMRKLGVDWNLFRETPHASPKAPR